MEQYYASAISCNCTGGGHGLGWPTVQILMYIPEFVRIFGVFMYISERNSVCIPYISVFKNNTVYICQQNYYF